jgi:hypothetical protein
MDKITDTLNHQSKKHYHPAIQAAMKLAAKKIDRYYAHTDSSDAYRIAMSVSVIYYSYHRLIILQVLHPGLKLEYFRMHEWEQDWIKVAKDMVRDEYNLNYKGKAESVRDDKKESKDVTVSQVNTPFILISP